jgi:hypothetical protein
LDIHLCDSLRSPYCTLFFWPDSNFHSWLWYWRYMSRDFSKDMSQSYKGQLHRHFGLDGGSKGNQPSCSPVTTFCLNRTPVTDAGNVYMSKYSPCSLHKRHSISVKQAIKTNRVKTERW